MKIAEIPFAVLRFQYQIARIPFQLIEDQMAARLYSEAPARLFYERSLGTLDATIGNLLGDARLQRRGAALVERSDARRHPLADRAERVVVAHVGQSRRDGHRTPSNSAIGSRHANPIAQRRMASVIGSVLPTR